MSLFSKLSKNNEKSLYPWSQKKLGGSNSAIPRVGHAATTLSAETIVIYGGIHKNSTKKDLFLINIQNLFASSISAYGDIPTPRISPIIASIHGLILMYGGEPHAQDEPYDGSFYVFNLRNDCLLDQRLWTRLRMDGYKPVERSGHTAVVHEGIIYVFGGQLEGNYFNDLFMFNTSTLDTQPILEQLDYNNEGPEPRSGHVSCFFENKLYIFGGTNDQRLFNDIWSFDLHSRLWTCIEVVGYVPAPRESCASAIVDSTIYIIGGRGIGGVELNDLNAYRIKGRRWFTFQNMGLGPSRRHGSTMTAIKDRLFVIGGENDSGKMEDAAFVHILDSSRIKYPPDTPAHQQTKEKVQYVRHQHSFDDPSEILHPGSPRSLISRAQEQGQYQQQYPDSHQRQMQSAQPRPTISNKSISSREVENNYETENQSLKYRIDECEQQIKILDNKIKLLENEKRAYQSTSVQQTQALDALEQEKQMLERDKANITNEVERVKASYTTLEQLLKAKEDTIASLNRENQMLSTVNQGHQQGANDMVETLKNLLQGKNAEIELLKQNMEHLLANEQRRVGALEEENRRLKQERNQQQATVQNTSPSNNNSANPTNIDTNHHDQHDDPYNDINYETENSDFEEGDADDINYDTPSEDEGDNSDLNYDGAN